MNGRVAGALRPARPGSGARGIWIDFRSRHVSNGGFAAAIAVAPLRVAGLACGARHRATATARSWVGSAVPGRGESVWCCACTVWPLILAGTPSRNLCACVPQRARGCDGRAGRRALGAASARAVTMTRGEVDAREWRREECLEGPPSL